MAHIPNPIDIHVNVVRPTEDRAEARAVFLACLGEFRLISKAFVDAAEAFEGSIRRLQTLAEQLGLDAEEDTDDRDPSDIIADATAAEAYAEQHDGLLGDE